MNCGAFGSAALWFVLAMLAGMAIFEAAERLLRAPA